MGSVKLPLADGWYIAYRAGTGRTLAHSKCFETREAAQAVIDQHGLNQSMHVIEVPEKTCA
jgi:hypothetical protein